MEDDDEVEEDEVEEDMNGNVDIRVVGGGSAGSSSRVVLVFWLDAAMVGVISRGGWVSGIESRKRSEVPGCCHVVPGVGALGDLGERARARAREDQSAGGLLSPPRSASGRSRGGAPALCLGVGCARGMLVGLGAIIIRGVLGDVERPGNRSSCNVECSYM